MAEHTHHVHKERVVSQGAYRTPAGESVVARRIIYIILDTLEALLLFRFVFRALGANSLSAFVSFMYTITAPFVAPFQAVFQSLRSNGMVFEWTTLLAMLVYYLVARLIINISTAGTVKREEVYEVRVEEGEPPRFSGRASPPWGGR